MADSKLKSETQRTTDRLQLQPHKTYQCCVSAVNQAGIGTPSCKLIATYEEGNVHTMQVAILNKRNKFSMHSTKWTSCQHHLANLKLLINVPLLAGSTH